jgi:hypothetical protein
MILITSSQTRRLIYFKYLGRVTAEEMRARMDEVDVMLAQFTAGFRLLSDLTELHSMEEACLPEIARVMDLCKKAGIEIVVRIIPDPRKDIGLNILSVFHYGRSVRMVTCKDFAEATGVLKL